MLRQTIIPFFAFLMLLFAFQPEQGLAQDALVEIKDIEPEEIEVAGFILDNQQEIKIEAVGAHRRSRHSIVSAAWILNADNRKVVWELTDANSKWKSRKLREYRDAVTLPKGRYELYYSFFPPSYHDNGWSFTDFFFRSRDDEYLGDAYEDFRIAVFGNGKSLSRGDTENYQKQVKERAVINLTMNRDDQYENQGFELKKPADLIVYSIGEARDDGSYDYGWIMNTETREQVWKFDYRHSDYAGGSEKNRMIRETISLPAGKYAAFFVTDDTHSPREWNAPPPYDPAFWGMVIYAKNESDKRDIKLFTYEDIPVKNVVVELTRVGDDEYLSRGFTLKKDMNLRIYALGEGMRGEMYDYGWIENAKTHKRVWEMDYRDTEHAGGNIKNRLYDRVVSLEKGNYVVHYATDGSHSYRDWNASPPFDQDKWGITLIGADDDFNPKDVADYTPEKDKSIIAQLIKVRDWETRKERFSLDKDSEVRIYALGEGRNGRMFDYGWIEEANTGKIVWEMTYRKTDHAGGARKNRVFDDTVFLQAGKYVLIYQSDDSHSFKDWNASPPRDRINWGITLYMVEGD